MARTAQTPALQGDGVRDFSGGPNLRDSAPQLAQNELADAYNVTLDERGGAASRLGYTADNAGPFSGGLVISRFWSQILNDRITQAGPSLYLGATNTARHTFSTSETVTFCEMNSLIVACHPTDGLYTSTDGTTWTVVGQLGTVTVTVASPAVFTLSSHGLVAGDPVKFTTTGALPGGLTAGTTYYVIAAGLTTNTFEVSTAAGGSAVNTSGTQSGTHTAFRANIPTGTCVAVWQSKVWVGQPDGTVRWSDIADPQTWPADNFNKLWEKDQEAIVALHPGSGQDIQGRPGLLCFKQESTYRVDDSATGSYTTVDGSVGAAGPLAVTGVGSRVYAVGKQGVFWWREDQVGMVNASDALRPLWREDQLDYTSLAGWCCGRQNGRVYVSVRRAGSAANDLAFEHDPDVGWITPRSDAMSCYATSTGDSEILYGGSPTVSGQCYQLNTGGTDDGDPIVGWLQTRWFELNNGFETMVWQLRIHGRGSGTVTTLTDYAFAGGDQRPFDLSSQIGTWDDGGFWDDGGLWETEVLQATQPVFSIGRCRQFSLRFDFSCDSVYDAPQILGSGTNRQVGQFALFGAEWLYVPLGLS